MLDLIISGCNGRMGHVLEEICLNSSDLQVAAGFDILGTTDRDFPVYAAPSQYKGAADVLVDFSHPSALSPLLDYCMERKLPAVLATTGYQDEQLEEISRASAQIPIFRSANFSLGVNVLSELVRQAAVLLGEDFDVEIVERHHNKKLDAPSGTALMLAKTLSQALPYEPEYIYDRHTLHRPRSRREIGISAIRGGTIAGDHEIIFAGRDETLELRHVAQSREVFATGALKAARFLSCCRLPGLYSMKDLTAWMLEKKN